MIGLLVPFFSDYAMVHSILYTSSFKESNTNTTNLLVLYDLFPVQIELLDDQGLGNWMVPWIEVWSLKAGRAIFAEETGGYVFRFWERVGFDFFLANDVLFDGWRTMLDTLTLKLCPVGDKRWQAGKSSMGC